VGGQCHAPAALPTETGTHCIGSWVGPRAGGRLRKISPPPGIDPRTFQPVAIRYTYCAIPAPNYNYARKISNLLQTSGSTGIL
jgi:hypothetical protein